ncbi:MAG: NAD(P)-dependent oxidoreductase [Bacteroidales bacterium]|nr:NAD(P)-dependent oxidoreductase [Bacteroidales bacterium]
MKRNIFLTGATGTMGWAGLHELLAHPDRYAVTILARKSPANEKKLAPLADKIRIVWGDLMNYDDVLRGVSGADVVLHVGGMVSPQADYFPEKTLKVNVTSAENVVRAILAQPNDDDIKAVYIGSVAQTSDRSVPLHWGRTGDPVCASVFDFYGVSKIIAERVFADSGLRHWVSLRQSGILHPGILKNFDPIMFHVPIKGVLEWATLEDSGRLLERVCRDDVPDEFWNRFYNISSGPDYRMTNYEFEKRLLKAVHCPPPEKIFNANWFVLKNFHGEYYLDAEVLESYLHFRGNIPLDDYFRQMSDSLPSFFKLAAIVPSPIIKLALRTLAYRKTYGTQYWIKHRDEEHIRAYYGSLEAYRAIPDWKDWDLTEPPGKEQAVHIDHGYDESIPLEKLTLNDLQKAAAFRGGKLLSEAYDGDPAKKLRWCCHDGHEFEASPKLILEGGHWCPECLPPEWGYEEQAAHSPFLAQVMRP